MAGYWPQYRPCAHHDGFLPEEILRIKKFSFLCAENSYHNVKTPSKFLRILIMLMSARPDENI